MMKRLWKLVPPPADRIVLGARAVSWWRSAGLGLMGGIFYAPGTLLGTLAEPLTEILAAVVKILVGIPIWALARVLFVVAGLLGFVRTQEAGKP